MLKTAGLILITFLQIVSAGIFAQSKEELNKIDSVSFALYNSSKWEKLLDYFESYSSRVEKNYYFIMRRGIAYFSEENYLSALEDFKSAVKLDPSQEAPKEYLYYCYLNTGRKEDADILASDFSRSLKKKIKFSKPGFFSGIYTEHSYSIGSSISKENGQNQQGQYLYEIHGSPGSYLYNNISLIHSFGSRVSLFHSYNHFSYNTNKLYKISGSPETLFVLNSSQNDYYSWLTVNAGKGFNIGGGVHLIYLETEDVYMEQGVPSQPGFTAITGSSNYFSAGLSISKYTGRFNIGVNGSVSDMNNTKQYQTGFGITYFPMGNLNLYFNLNSQLCFNKLKGSPPDKRLVIEPKLGFRISDFFWAETYYTIGNIYNYSENNLFTIFNNTQTIDKRFGINLIIPVKYNKLELSLRYQYLNVLQENAYYFDTVNFEIKTTNQSINKLTGGIKWSF